MQYLTVEQVLFIHLRLIQETGGSGGLRDLARLQAAIERPKATFDQEDLYPDIFIKAAALMESLIKNHPFIDGNKRTGITATILFLVQNQYQFRAKNDELHIFTLRVAQNKFQLVEIAQWLVDHTNSVK